MNNYLSIITNFGCHYSCPYCIVKNNNLNIPKTTLCGLEKLPHYLSIGKYDWVSLSGGGDPLFQFLNHKEWYDKFFTLVPDNIKLELHTSYINEANAPYEKFDRVVYHLHSLEQLKLVKRVKQQITRVVFVVSENFTEDLIKSIAAYCADSSEIDELSFRQMVDSNYQETDYCQEYLRAGHQKLWWYIEQNDYNTYYCENRIYNEYKKIGEQI